jgi:hypothetical protein
VGKKNMRQFLPFSFFCFLFSSCTTYQYMTVNSNNIQQNDKKEFLLENDSFSLKYNFNGVYGPVNLEVKNKLDKPVYIDWKRSALIINDRAFSYAPGSLTVSGSTSTSITAPLTGNHNLNDISTSTSVQSTVQFPGDREFIPPTAQVNRMPLHVTGGFLDVAAGTEYQRVKVPMATGYMATLNIASFSETNSPLRFASYLTLYVEGDLDKPVVFKHDFYISEILNTGRAPSNFRGITHNEGNFCYVRKSTGAGTAIGVIALVGVAVVVANNVPDTGNPTQ